MSSESTSKDQNGEWVMPEPVFRSSEGRTPGSKSEAVTDEIETETAVPDGAETVDEQTDVFDETSMNHVRAAPAKPVEAKTGGCATSAMMMIAVIAFLAVAVIGAVFYFLYYSPGADRGPF